MSRKNSFQSKQKRKRQPLPPNVNDAFNAVLEGWGGVVEHYICLDHLRSTGRDFDSSLTTLELAIDFWASDYELRTSYPDVAKRTEYLFAEGVLSFDGGDQP